MHLFDYISGTTAAIILRDDSDLWALAIHLYYTCLFPTGVSYQFSHLY